MGAGSLTVWDDEAQQARQRGELRLEENRWGDELTAFARVKGMPKEAVFYTRRNSAGNGTIFEWD